MFILLSKKEISTLLTSGKILLFILQALHYLNITASIKITLMYNKIVVYMTKKNIYTDKLRLLRDPTNSDKCGTEAAGSHRGDQIVDRCGVSVRTQAVPHKRMIRFPTENTCRVCLKLEIKH